MKTLRQKAGFTPAPDGAGFTLIELALTMGIFLLLFYLASAAFINMQRSSLLKDHLWQMATVLRQAQHKAGLGTAVNDQHLRYGVIFGTDYYQEFATLSDYANRELSKDLMSKLPQSLEFTERNLPDNCLTNNDCLIFSSLSGVPHASGSVILRNNSQEQKEIIINEEGQVSF